MGRHVQAVTFDQVVASLKVSPVTLYIVLFLLISGAVRKHHLLQLWPHVDQSLNPAAVSPHCCIEAYADNLLGFSVDHHCSMYRDILYWSFSVRPCCQILGRANSRALC